MVGVSKLSLSDTKKGVGCSCFSAYPGNMGLRIASTIRISNANKPTPRHITKMPHRWQHHQWRTVTTHSAQTFRCSACYGFDFCEVYVPTGQTPENVFLNRKIDSRARRCRPNDVAKVRIYFVNSKCFHIKSTKRGLKLY